MKKVITRLLRSAILTVTTLTALTGAASAQNIVSNPSFEAPDIGGSFVNYGAGSLALTDWTIGGAGIDHIDTLWVAQDGGQSLDVNGVGPGTISQTLDTTPGQQYLISFFIAGNIQLGPTIKSLQVTFAASSVTEDFDITGATAAEMNWSNRSFVATATAAQTVLTFTSLTTGSGGPALDNVSVTAITSGAAAPEPGTLALALIGLGGLGGVVLRRK